MIKKYIIAFLKACMQTAKEIYTIKKELDNLYLEQFKAGNK